MTDEEHDCCVEPEFSNGVANEAKQQLVSTAVRAHRLELALVALAAVAVAVSSATAVVVGLGNRDYQRRIRDCTQPEGKCYQETQRTTAQAVQAILDHINNSFSPHRLRNEAENHCQVEVFAGLPSFATKGVSAAVDYYDRCVLIHSGNTQPPPLPPNPLTSTTTTGGHP